MNWSVVVLVTVVCIGGVIFVACALICATLHFGRAEGHLESIFVWNLPYLIDLGPPSAVVRTFWLLTAAVFVAGSLLFISDIVSVSGRRIESLPIDRLSARLKELSDNTKWFLLTPLPSADSKLGGGGISLEAHSKDGRWIVSLLMFSPIARLDSRIDASGLFFDRKGSVVNLSERAKDVELIPFDMPRACEWILTDLGGPITEKMKVQILWENKDRHK